MNNSAYELESSILSRLLITARLLIRIFNFINDVIFKRRVDDLTNVGRRLSVGLCLCRIDWRKFISTWNILFSSSKIDVEKCGVKRSVEVGISVMLP